MAKITGREIESHANVDLAEPEIKDELRLLGERLEVLIAAAKRHIPKCANECEVDKKVQNKRRVINCYD
jgi:hypothetical protein